MTRAAQLSTSQFVFESLPQHFTLVVGVFYIVLRIFAQLLAILLCRLLWRENEVGRHARYSIHLHPEVRQVKIVKHVLGCDAHANFFTNRKYQLVWLEIVPVLLILPILPQWISTRNQPEIAAAQLTVGTRITKLPGKLKSRGFNLHVLFIGTNVSHYLIPYIQTTNNQKCHYNGWNRRPNDLKLVAVRDK